MSEELDGYWPSPWPAEDGGPTRRQRIPADRTLAGEWTAASRQHFGANMVVLRDPGEVYLQGNTFGGSTSSWVERIDPVSLECVVRSPDLDGGPFWAGGFAVHRNGDLYVTYGRWCHRLDPHTLVPKVSAQLPRERPYNSLLILPDGHLVMKDFCGGSGVHAITNGDRGSELVVLEPDNLRVVARLELSEGSIARLSAYPDADGSGATVVVVGDQSCQQVHWDGAKLRLASVSGRYLRFDGQTFGWDAVIAAGSAWFLDDGEGTNGFGPSFRGKGVSTAPLHLVRVDLAGTAAEPVLAEVHKGPGGIVANPPLVDEARHIALGYDSGHGVLVGFDFPAETAHRVDSGHTPDAAGPAAAPTVRWHREQHHAGHMLFDATNGLALTNDYDHDAGVDQAVVVELASGAVVSSTPTASSLQSVLFPATGWADDFYVVSFSTLTRLHRP